MNILFKVLVFGIHLNNKNLKTFLTFNFNYLGSPMLSKLDFSQNNIQVIPKKFFHSSNILFNLILKNNSIRNIETGLFDGLKKLSTLDLSFNNISSIESGEKPKMI